VSMEKDRGGTHRVVGFSFSQTNLDRTEDVVVDRGQCIMKHPLCSGDLRTGQLSLILHLHPAIGSGCKAGRAESGRTR
jgi:hypothetical protein